MALNIISCLASFPKFGALPTEVRLLIWQHALPAPRIIYICENSLDDADDLGIDEEDLLQIIFFCPPACIVLKILFSRGAASKHVSWWPADTNLSLALQQTPQQRIWNGFASIQFGVETESVIAWPEDIRVDLSRDILFLGVRCVAFFEDIFKVPGLDWPRI